MTDYLGQFDFQSCRDLVEKLERERLRFENTQNREQQADHAVNFCLTAWHLIDWTYTAAKANQLEFRLSDGTEPNWETLKDYRNYLYSRCEDIRYLDVVANTWKHREIRQRPNRPEIKVTASATTTMAQWERLSDLSALDQPFVWKVVDGEKREAWKDVFMRVSGFWHELVYGETRER